MIDTKTNLDKSDLDIFKSIISVEKALSDGWVRTYRYIEKTIVNRWGKKYIYGISIDNDDNITGEWRKTVITKEGNVESKQRLVEGEGYYNREDSHWSILLGNQMKYYNDIEDTHYSEKVKGVPRNVITTLKPKTLTGIDTGNVKRYNSLRVYRLNGMSLYYFLSMIFINTHVSDFLVVESIDEDTISRKSVTINGKQIERNMRYVKGCRYILNIYDYINISPDIYTVHTSKGESVCRYDLDTFRMAKAFMLAMTDSQYNLYGKGYEALVNAISNMITDIFICYCILISNGADDGDSANPKIIDFKIGIPVMLRPRLEQFEIGLITSKVKGMYSNKVNIVKDGLSDILKESGVDLNNPVHIENFIFRGLLKDEPGLIKKISFAKITTVLMAEDKEKNPNQEILKRLAGQYLAVKRFSTIIIEEG